MILLHFLSILRFLDSQLLILRIQLIEGLDKCIVDVLVEVAKLNAFEILDVACHAPVEHRLDCDETVKIRREAIGAS